MNESANKSKSGRCICGCHEIITRVGGCEDCKSNHRMSVKEYTDQAISKALERAGAFFSFSRDQFDEAKKEGVTYINLDMGLICPKDTAKSLLEEIKMITKKSVQKDIKENGIDEIIKRELINHEAFYTGELEDTLNVLRPYLVTVEQIKEVYLREKNNVEC